MNVSVKRSVRTDGDTVSDYISYLDTFLAGLVFFRLILGFLILIIVFPALFFVAIIIHWVAMKYLLKFTIKCHTSGI